jgi:hypothetical protein
MRALVLLVLAGCGSLSIQGGDNFDFLVEAPGRVYVEVHVSSLDGRTRHWRMSGEVGSRVAFRYGEPPDGFRQSHPREGRAALPREGERLRVWVSVPSKIVQGEYGPDHADFIWRQGRFVPAEK